MQNDVKNILSGLTRDDNGIYISKNFSDDQKTEIALRTQVAEIQISNVLAEVSIHHSVPVMDHEVKSFLARIPPHGMILDVGGCWGWHWRQIAQYRPDVKIFLIDLVYTNLENAKRFLGPLLDHQVFLIHADALHLPFDPDTFDGYWSVQTLQHIKNFERAVQEAYRVLKSTGIFSSYSLNIQRPILHLYHLLGKDYHIKGDVTGRYYLERGSQEQADIVTKVFMNKCSLRWTEVLFKPELNFHKVGKENSLLGKLDNLLSGTNFFSRSFGRQISYHARKQITLQ